MRKCSSNTVPMACVYSSMVWAMVICLPTESALSPLNQQRIQLSLRYCTISRNGGEVTVRCTESSRISEVLRVSRVSRTAFFSRPFQGFLFPHQIPGAGGSLSWRGYPVRIAVFRFLAHSFLALNTLEKKSPILYPHPRNQPDNLLSCRRVHNPSQDQPGHRDEEGPEDILHLLVLPERLDSSSRVRLHCPLDQLRQEHEQRRKRKGDPEENQDGQVL